MKYYIKKINRYVELDDKRINLFQQIADPDDSLFLISIYGTVLQTDGDASALSDEKWSDICNMALLKELRMYTLLPSIMNELPHIKEKLSVLRPASVDIKKA